MGISPQQIQETQIWKLYKRRGCVIVFIVSCVRSSVDRALASGARSRGFETLRTRHSISRNPLLIKGFLFCAKMSKPAATNLPSDCTVMASDLNVVY